MPPFWSPTCATLGGRLNLKRHRHTHCFGFSVVVMLVDPISCDSLTSLTQTRPDDWEVLTDIGSVATDTVRSNYSVRQSSNCQLAVSTTGIAHTPCLLSPPSSNQFNQMCQHEGRRIVPVSKRFVSANNSCHPMVRVRRPSWAHFACAGPS